MKNIVVVEDDPFAHDFYRFILKKANYTPLIMEDGDKIIETLNTDDIALVIMDINLKNTYFKGQKIDGVQLTRYIKQNIPGNIPVLLVTAYSPTIKGNKFLEESLAEDYIVKPIIDYNVLLEKINQMVNNG